jgi:hypothetical protein
VSNGNGQRAIPTQALNTHRPRLVLHWINSRVIGAAALDYLIQCVGEQMFRINPVTNGLSIRDDPPRNRRRTHPDITVLDIDLEGFYRPAGPHARNS